MMSPSTATRSCSGGCWGPRWDWCGVGRTCPRRLSWRRSRFPGDASDPCGRVGERPAQKSRALPGFIVSWEVASDGLNVRRLLALRALCDFEAHFLAFLQRLESRHVDRREMCEQVFASAVGRNEAEALRVVEPLNRSSWHFPILYVKKKAGS